MGTDGLGILSQRPVIDYVIRCASLSVSRASQSGLAPLTAYFSCMNSVCRLFCIARFLNNQGSKTIGLFEGRICRALPFILSRVPQSMNPDDSVRFDHVKNDPVRFEE